MYANEGERPTSAGDGFIDLMPKGSVQDIVALLWQLAESCKKSAYTVPFCMLVFFRLTDSSRLA